ncbi:DUF7657 domain-containing protein [Luteimonas sp. SDU82]|uniref:DUF7657 domain-containing protein n=1 Tax=Luteimonas sp. SDU82 TaxID=3422592 RepID=UPI003EBEC49E
MSTLGLPRTQVVAELEMSAASGERGELFYRSHDNVFTQGDSRAFVIQDDGKPHSYTIELPVSKRIDRIRIDPASGRGEVVLHSFEIRDSKGVQRFDGRALFDARGQVNQSRLELSANGDLVLHSFGNDPYVEISLPRPARGPHASVVALQRLLLALAAAVLLAGSCAGIMRARPAWTGLERFQRWGRYLDDELLVFTPAVCATFALIAASAVLFVGLKLHQSSIEVWEHAYPRAPVEQAIDVGPPRHIRSDEWKVHTPWVLNQVQAGSPSVNHNVGGATAPLVAGVPVADPVGWPNIKYAGFRFLDIERGYAWSWAYKSFGLALSFLWLLLILTRGNLPASLAGTVWVYFSSYTQWWFSSALPEIMTAFALGTVGALYSLFSGSRRMIAVGAVLVVYAATSLALNLYPPFILPLGYLAVAILVGYGLERGGLGRFRQEGWFRSTVLLAAVVATALYGVWFFHAASSAIASMMDTAYPGRRVASSGGVPVSKLMHGFFEAFRIGETHFPKLPFSYNASEASGHLIMLPLAFMLVPLGLWFRRRNALLTSMACACAIAFAWVVFALPAPVNQLLQIAGWSSVTPKRALMALGVGSILLCTVLVARMQASRPSTGARRLSWITVPLAACAVFYLGWRLRQADPAFFTWQVLALGTLATTLIAIGISRGQVRFLATGIAIVALPAATVNPLTSGLSSILDKPVLQAAKRQGGAPGDRWVAIGDNFFAQGLKSVGLEVWGGTHVIPDRPALERLDPSLRYIGVWNRYSTISIASEPGLTAPRFELIHPDQYRVVLDVCGSTLQELGITHVAYTVAVPAADLRCLTPLDAPDDSGVRLFRLAGR